MAGADYLFPQSYLEFHPHLFLVPFVFWGVWGGLGGGGNGGRSSEVGFRFPYLGCMHADEAIWSCRNLFQWFFADHSVMTE